MSWLDWFREWDGNCGVSKEIYRRDRVQIDAAAKEVGCVIYTKPNRGFVGFTKNKSVLRRLNRNDSSD